jgi:hypothetical protein
VSHSGTSAWVEQLSAFCHPAMKWTDPAAMHKACRGQFIAHMDIGNRTYARCTCQCHELPVGREPGED